MPTRGSRPPTAAACSTLLLLQRRGRRGPLFLEERRDVALAAIEVRHALVHPLRARLAEQVVIEELVHVDGPVLHVVAVAEAVLLTVEGEHVGLLAEAPHRGEPFDPLVP